VYFGVKIPPPPAHSIGHRNHHQHLVPSTPAPHTISPDVYFHLRTRNRAPVARFRVIGSKPHPARALSNERPNRHNHLVSSTSPTPSTAPDVHFHLHAQNRATSARFRVIGPKPHPPRKLSNGCRNRYHHLVPSTPASPSITSDIYFHPHTRNRATGARFQVIGPKPHPPRKLSNRRPNRYHHLVSGTPSSHSNASDIYFHPRTRNRATSAQFRVIGPKLPDASYQMDAPTDTTTSSSAPQHPLPSPPPSIAYLKPSHGRSVSGYCPKTPPRASYRTGAPTDTTTSSSAPHQSPPLPPTSISTCAPETEPPTLGFGLLVQNPNPTRIIEQAPQPLPLGCWFWHLRILFFSLSPYYWYLL
jgi:hypothetical protein